jgi:hypothetical protein
MSEKKQWPPWGWDGFLFSDERSPLMQRESIAKKMSRFNRCDERFYPYIEKVLIRLPEEICFESVLDDLNFEIVSFGEWFGGFCQLPTPIKNLIVLNEDILRQPEFQVIHTIAHEVAHKIIGKGESGLYEKEAEELLVKWGFQEEVEKADYARTWLEGGGYKIGYEWAAKQPDLSRFEDFYDEWEQGKLDEGRWEELYYEADTDSIAYEMGQMDEGVDIKTADDLSKIPVPPKTVIDDGSYGKGVIYGIMGFLKKKKQEVLRNLSKPELSESEKDELFWITLKEALLSCNRLYDQRIQLVTWHYGERYPEIKAFQDALLQVGTLLEEKGRR